jgi:hypothetical protein
VLNAGFEKPLISYSPMAKPAHPYHGNAYITIKRMDEGQLEIPAKQVIASSIGFTSILTFHPISGSFADRKCIKCFFNGEVPPEIFESSNRRKENLNNEERREAEEKIVTGHILTIVQNYFKQANLNKGAVLEINLVESSLKYGMDKDKLKVQAFTVEPHLASRAGIEIGENKFVLTGDSAVGSNYQFGYGLNNAFKHARKLGEVFRRHKTIMQYNSAFECSSIFPPPFSLSTRITNFCCFKPLLGPGIDAAIEESYNQFIRQNAALIIELGNQEAIQEMEERMKLPLKTVNIGRLALCKEKEEDQRNLWRATTF